MGAFQNIILIGRAGAGKSEFIDFLKKVPDKERLEKYHIGNFDEMDDFPWLYSIFKDEDIWEKVGKGRHLTQRIQNVYITYAWDFYDTMTLKFNLEVGKKLVSDPNFYDKKTLFLEFARGQEDCYKRVFNELLDKELLKRSVVLFLDNTYEESMRRNTVRSTEGDKKQTILHHKIPVEVMEHFYKINDWHKLTGGKPAGYLAVQGLQVPYVTVWNMPESHDFKELERRYSSPLQELWGLWSAPRDLPFAVRMPSQEEATV